MLILSLFPINSPLDANVVITDNLDEIEKLLKRELKNHGILYLGKRYEKGTIINFNISEIKKIIKLAPVDHLFIEADSTKGRSVSGYDRVPVTLFSVSDRVVNLIGADALNQVTNQNWLDSTDPFWQDKRVIQPMDIFDFIKYHPMSEKLADLNARKTFFINKVENTFIENLSIPLAKELKMTGIERVILGSVFNSNLHLIR